MNEADMSEILEVTVWVEKIQFNKNMNLDIFNVTNNTIIVGDFHAASTTWGCSY